MISDRIFGLVAALVALVYIASATQIQMSFLSDPVGPRVFPIIIGSVAALCSLFLVFKPDPDPEWPVGKTLLALAIAVGVLVIYAFTIKPLGFMIPTTLVAAVLSYQISPNIKYAAMTGLGLSVGLFTIFKFALGLGLVAFPSWITG